MGFGGKKFWRSVAELGLSIAPGGAIVKGVGGLVLSQLLKPDSDEQKRFKGWVAFAKTMKDLKDLTNEERWDTLVSRVTDDLGHYYGEPPKFHDVMFNASAALKEARREFED